MVSWDDIWERHCVCECNVEGGNFLKWNSENLKEFLLWEGHLNLFWRCSKCHDNVCTYVCMYTYIYIFWSINFVTYGLHYLFHAKQIFLVNTPKTPSTYLLNGSFLLCVSDTRWTWYQKFQTSTIKKRYKFSNFTGEFGVHLYTRLYRLVTILINKVLPLYPENILLECYSQ